MTTSAAPRWALSFADLCLVLLGFVLLMQAQRGNPAAVTAGIREAFGAPPLGGFDRIAAPLFEPGEAILRSPAHAELAAIGRRARSSGGTVHIESIGTDTGSLRFDGWEIAAARAAAAARAVREGGLAADRIDVSVAATRGRGQRLRITTGRARG